MGQLCCRDPRPGVAHPYIQLATVRLRSDRDPISGPAELHGVAEQIAEDLKDAIPVAPYLDVVELAVLVNFDPLLGRKRLVELDALRDEQLGVPHLELHRQASCLDAGHVEEVAD